MEKGKQEVRVMEGPPILDKAISHECQEGSQSFDPKIVSKLRRKMDFIVLPTLVVMYTFKLVNLIPDSTLEKEN